MFGHLRRASSYQRAKVVMVGFASILAIAVSDDRPDAGGRRIDTPYSMPRELPEN